MFKKIYFLTICSILAISNLLTAVEYDIQDIGTLQTKASEAIAINNRGQILGWYNIDGSKEGKHFFVRDRDGDFHELPSKENSADCEINWRFLTGYGKVYGTFDGDANFSVLYSWDRHNGVVKLGDLPNKEIVSVNNAGKVLIRSVVENENGRSIRRPVIWKNGLITKIHGLEGNIGIESEESYGLDLNNKGEVVGYSIAYLSYKNDIYKQIHAVKWAANGEITDLHNKVPKSTSTQALSINDLGDVIISSRLVREDGKVIPGSYHGAKKSNKNHFLNKNSDCVLDRDGKQINPGPQAFVNSELYTDYDSIWMRCIETTGINDKGEIIAIGSTIYGEQHAMLLTPIKSE